MDNAANHNFTDKRMCQINQCQMYLQVETLLDISTASGNAIQKNVYNNENPKQSQSWKFMAAPSQSRPKSMESLKNIFVQGYTKNQSRRLQTPMDAWMENSKA